jgi:polysaccharide export outer membrane protein
MSALLHSGLGSSLSMAVTVRGVTDWLKLVCLLALLAAAVPSMPLGAQSQTEETPQQTNERIQKLATLARVATVDPPVGAGDLLHIDVFDVPELSRDVRITDSGVISFPLVPERIQAAGLTIFQLERSLEQTLSADGLVAHPQVSIFVKEQTSQPVTIVGAVGHPTVMQIVRPTTLLELLASAGGITDEAGSTILVTRAMPPADHIVQISEPVTGTESPARSDTPLQSTTTTIQLKDLLESGNSDYNIQVRGGDIVSVPRAGVVYVLGFGVAQQGEYVLQAHGDQITALKAVALAHGMTSFAKGDDSVIMRDDPATGKRIQIPVQLKKIQKHEADDIPLQTNDILFVPDSRGKKALARGAEAAIGIGTSVAVYRVQ